MFLASLHLPAVFDIHRLDIANRGDEVCSLLRSVACQTPCSYVVFRWASRAVLQLAYLGEVPARRGGQHPPAEVRILADLTETGSKSFPCLAD